jgi:hypothetical protein
MWNFNHLFLVKRTWVSFRFNWHLNFHILSFLFGLPYKKNSTHICQCCNGDSTSMLGWLDRWRRRRCRVRRERGKAAAALRRVGATARLPCAGLGDTMIGWRFGLFGLCVLRGVWLINCSPWFRWSVIYVPVLIWLVFLWLYPCINVSVISKGYFRQSHVVCRVGGFTTNSKPIV